MPVYKMTIVSYSGTKRPPLGTAEVYGKVYRRILLASRESVAYCGGFIP